MKIDTSYPFVIIGNGAAGVSSVEGIRHHNQTDRILIISKEIDKFYSKPGLAYWLLGNIPEKLLYPHPVFDDKRWGIERLHENVVAIDPHQRIIRLEDGRRVQFRRLLIATGARAIRPRIEGIDLKGVVTLDSIDDTREILKLARKAKRAVVVGGGITALELAEGLAARKVETHYLLRRDRYWSNVLDEHESRLVEGRLEEEGIHLHFRVEVEKIFAKKDRVAGVALSTGESFPCDMVGVAIGIRPQTGVVEGTPIEIDRGILVDETFRTSVEGIYAAGDVAQVWDSRSQQYVLDSLWGIAREQGRVAGMNMAGVREPYQRKVPFNVTRIGGITTTLIGCIGQREVDEDLVAIARGDSEIWRSSGEGFVIKNEAECNRVRLLIGARTIQGALIMGDQSLSRSIQHLVAEQIDITPIREHIVSDPGSLGAVLLHFYSDGEGGRNAR